MTARIWKFLLLALLLLPTPFALAGPLNLTGRILDSNGRPVGGAEVYVFDSANTKRPADYISEKSGSDGHYQLALPSGRYWTMAIQRQGEARVGPLGPTDRFSGEPLLFEGGDDKQVVNDFTIISLKEAALRNRKRNEELIKVTGRIFDPSGAPVAGAYAMADPSPKGQLPLYLSTWSEADGLYTLFLPKGRIFLGVSRVFPPDSDYHLDREADFSDDAVGEDLLAPPVTEKGSAPATGER
jgi:hypothetical protein